MNDVKAQPRNVSMYNEQWDMVDQVDRQYGFRSTSTALRYIVERYRELTEQQSEKVNNGREMVLAE